MGAKKIEDRKKNRTVKFSDKDWDITTNYAEKYGVNISEYIRRACRQELLTNEKEIIIKQVELYPQLSSTDLDRLFPDK